MGGDFGGVVTSLLPFLLPSFSLTVNVVGLAGDEEWVVVTVATVSESVDGGLGSMSLRSIPESLVSDESTRGALVIESAVVCVCEDVVIQDTLL